MACIDEEVWEINRTLDFIIGNGFKRVALQLPDDLLRFSPGLAALLTERLGHGYTVAVLADTAFNAEAVDEVAARHMSADCVVHYGRASLAAVSQLPVCYVFPRAALDVSLVAQELAASLAALPLPAGTRNNTGGVQQWRRRAVLLLDQVYLHALGPLEAELSRQLLPDNCWSITLAQPATTHAAPAPTPSPSQPPAAARGPEAGFAGPGHGGHDEEGAQQPPDCSTSSDVGCSSSTACCQARPGCGPQPSPSMLQQQPPCPTKDGEPSGTCSGSSAHGAATRADDGQDASSGSSCAGALARPQEGAQPPSSTTLTVAGYSWQALPDASIPASGEQEGEVTPAARPLFVWVGPQASPSLQALQLALSTQDWLRYTPPPVPAGGSTLQGDEGDSAAASGSGGSAGGADGGGDGVGQGSCQGVTEVGLSPGTHALLKRRYFLVEKAKGASIVGILVGTLAVAGLREAMTNLRRLIAAADKHSYTMLVGKPNPTKLANFPEVDVWVMLADPLGYVLDSKPYLAPILTPYEALLALTGRSLSFEQPYLLDLACLAEADVGAVEAGQAAAEEAPGALVTSGRGQVARMHSQGQQLVAHNAAEYLQLVRSFKGLEAPVAGAAPKAPMAATEGQRGRAAVYSEEGTKAL